MISKCLQVCKRRSATKTPVLVTNSQLHTFKNGTFNSNVKTKSSSVIIFIKRESTLMTFIKMYRQAEMGVWENTKTVTVFTTAFCKNFLSVIPEIPFTSVKDGIERVPGLGFGSCWPSVGGRRTV